MRVNTFLRYFSLEKGVNMIGMNDIGALIVEIVLAILAMETTIFRTYFVLPVNRSYAYLIPL